LNTNKDSEYVSYLNNLITNIMIGPDNHKWVFAMENWWKLSLFKIWSYGIKYI